MRLLNRNEGTVRCFAVIFVLVLFTDLLVIVYLQSRSRISRSVDLRLANNAVEFLKLVNASYGPVRILDSLKLEDGIPIDISDVIVFSQNNTNAEAIRVVEVGGSGKGGRSEIRLKLPRDLTSCNVDTSKWKVVKDYIPPRSYYHLLAETMFYCGAVELSRDSSARILILGLAGGVIDGYLHCNFPNMNITVVEISSIMMYISSKWFGLSLDDNHSVVVADGLKFMMEEVKKGIKYDAVILDACYSRADRSRLCPSDIFLAEKAIKTISKVISNKGILVMNSVPLARNVNEESKMLAEKFIGFFHFCNTRDMGTGFGVFYCMHQSGSEEKHVNLLEYISNTNEWHYRGRIH